MSVIFFLTDLHGSGGALQQRALNPLPPGAHRTGPDFLIQHSGKKTNISLNIICLSAPHMLSRVSPRAHAFFTSCFFLEHLNSPFFHGNSVLSLRVLHFAWAHSVFFRRWWFQYTRNFMHLPPSLTTKKWKCFDPFVFELILGGLSQPRSSLSKVGRKWNLEVNPMHGVLENHGHFCNFLQS